MMRVELVGYKGWRAFNVYHKLVLGVKMLPLYMHETYEDFFGRVEQMPESDQEKVLKEALIFVDLEPEEVLALCTCAYDPLGIAYGPAQIKGLKPQELFNIMLAVAVEVSKIKIDFVNAAEKKK